MRWGIWGANFNTAQYESLIHQCIDENLTTFDHADIYGNYTTEADFGKVLQNNSQLRQQIQIITKAGIQMLSPNRPHHSIKSYNTSASHITQSLERSLKNFHTDYIDTLLIHRPDILLDVQEIAQVIANLKKQGKVKSFGVSNFTPSQVDLILSATEVEVHQVEISVTHLDAFENGVLDQCQVKKIQAQAWSPWGNGLFEKITIQHMQILETAKNLATKYETGVNEILLSFLYAHPSNITPVIGTTKMERILQAKNAIQIDLNREDFYKLWSASTSKEVA